MSLLFYYGDLIQFILQLFNYISLHLKLLDLTNSKQSRLMFSHQNKSSISQFSFIQIVLPVGLLGKPGIDVTKWNQLSKRYPNTIINFQNWLPFRCTYDFDICFQAQSYDPNFVPEFIPTAAAHSLAAILPPPAGRTRLIKIRPPSACTVTPSPPTETTSPVIPMPSTRALS